MGVEIFIAINLRRLRASRALTQQELADNAGLSRIALRDIENGTTKDPKVSTLQGIAKALGVTLTDLLAEVPQLSTVRFRASKKFTSHARAAREQILARAAFWLRDFNELQEVLRERRPFALAKVAKELKSIRGAGRPTRAAQMARKTLDIPPSEPIRDMSCLLESAGVKVYATPVDIGKFFGFSVAEQDGGPLVVVNTNSSISVERQIFTAAHELGHLLLHPSAYDIHRVDENEREEKEATDFASHFLMPQEAFEKEWKNTYGLMTVRRVLHVKRIFRVSYKTVLYRLVESDIANDKVWVGFQMEYKKLFGKSLKMTEEPAPLEEPFPLAPPDFVEGRLGALVRKAIEDEQISVTRGAEILDLRLDAMRERMASWSQVQQ